MAKYVVTVKNISTSIEKMTVQPGETVVRTVSADSLLSAQAKTLRKVFDGCGYLVENTLSDGTMFFEVVSRGKVQSVYGRAWVYTHDEKSS